MTPCSPPPNILPKNRAAKPSSAPEGVGTLLPFHSSPGGFPIGTDAPGTWVGVGLGLPREAESRGGASQGGGSQIEPPLPAAKSVCFLKWVMMKWQRM